MPYRKQSQTEQKFARSSRTAYRLPRRSFSKGEASRNYRIARASKGLAEIGIDATKKQSEPTLRFCALGGLEEIGRNMLFFEYKNEIIIFDAGLQFPEETTPGIDYIIPNIAYLESKKENIKALIITHAHLDHVGGIPYIVHKIGSPTIYTTRLSKEIINRRQEEFSNLPKLNFEIVKPGEIYKLGENFTAEFFNVTHNVPEGIGTILETPVGRVVHPGEFKFDYDHAGNPKGMEIWENLGKKKVHTLLLDSTGSEQPGFSLSERVVEAELEKLFKKAEGRIIVGTFSSMIDRIAEMIKIADKLGRKVAVSGFSMKSNIQIARNLGFIKPGKDEMIPLEEINKYRDDRILVLATGAQGDLNASLMRIANGEHKQIQIRKGDTIILSSSIVPGNERAVQVLKDDLARQGAIIYHNKMVDIHSSGHAPQEELKAVMKMIKPKFFIPIHGYYFMRWRNASLAKEINIPPNHIAIVDNGQFLNIKKESISLSEETAPAFYVMVDGLGVGDVGEIVLRDRRVLAQEGMVVLICTLDRRNGEFLKNPDIISRGFIYLKENKELVEELRKKIRLIIGRIPQHQQIEADYLKNMIRDQIGQFLYNRTNRRPMILPVVIEV